MYPEWNSCTYEFIALHMNPSEHLVLRVYRAWATGTSQALPVRLHRLSTIFRGLQEIEAQGPAAVKIIVPLVLRIVAEWCVLQRGHTHI